MSTSFSRVRLRPARLSALRSHRSRAERRELNRQCWRQAVPIRQFFCKVRPTPSPCDGQAGNDKDSVGVLPEFPEDDSAEEELYRNRYGCNQARASLNSARASPAAPEKDVGTSRF